MTDPKPRQWRNRFGTEPPEADEYIADMICANGCPSYMGGSRQIFVKKGVRREAITGGKCERCGCEARVG